MSGKIKEGLSVVILTKNEKEELRRCLSCLRNWADEIVIVDNYSDKETLKICDEFQCKVIVHPLNNDFSSQRNLGTEKAKGRWIFHLAPDEWLSEETKKKIEDALNGNASFVAFQLKRRNVFLGYSLKYCGAYGWDTRIFKKGFAYYKGKVHETLIVKGEVGKIEAEIVHFAFDNIKEVISTGNFYTEIEAEEFVKSRDSVSFREIRYRLTWKSLKLFWKLYVKKKGYKDGMYGLAWCILNVIGPQIRWLKIWEKALKERKLT